MLRYKLHTLLILLAVGPLAIALFLSDPLWFAMSFLIASLLAAIAYWPQIRGKGG